MKYIGQTGYNRLSREAWRGFSVLGNWVPLPQLLLLLWNIAVDQQKTPSFLIPQHLKRQLKKKKEKWGEYFHSSTRLAWKCIMAFKRKKKIMGFKSSLDFTVFFLQQLSIHLLLLFVWLLVTLLTQWDYMTVIKIATATGFPPLKAWTIIPCMGEVKVWLTIWFGDHLSYLSALVTSGLAPSTDKQYVAMTTVTRRNPTFG